ncbi:hypothetical protein FE781_02120 [Paenibacillus thermoaerophilus]|nr:hypothetical protein FE781_02120 [Paenibacillus thermoaerophilus]
MDPNRRRIERLLDPSGSLTREDVVWLLDYVRQKMAEGLPHLQQLPQPRLLAHFQAYADIALWLVHRRSFHDQDAARLKRLLHDAAFGLLPGRG